MSIKTQSRKRVTKAQIKRTKVNKRIALLVYTIAVMYSTALIGERFNEADNMAAIEAYLAVCLDDTCPESERKEFNRKYAKIERSAMNKLIAKQLKN